MIIRSIQAGEEGLWFHDEDKIQWLKNYRKDNPQLHPCSFLGCFLNQKMIARLRINTDEPDLYGITYLTVEPQHHFAEVGGMMMNYVKEHLNDRKIEAASRQIPEEDPWHTLLISSGFETYIEKVYVKRNLEGFTAPYDDPLIYQSIDDVGENLFFSLFQQIYTQHTNRNFTNAEHDFSDLKSSSGLVFKPSLWQVAYLKSKGVGILIPKIFDDVPDEGTIHNFGLFPEFRGLGLGKILHAKGLTDLAKHGAKRYIGSTDCRNQPMVAIFRQNGCEERGVRRHYQFKPLFENLEERLDKTLKEAP